MLGRADGGRWDAVRVSNERSADAAELWWDEAGADRMLGCHRKVRVSNRSGAVDLHPLLRVQDLRGSEQKNIKF